MATCKDCLHYGICVFHLKGDENQKCQHYIDDVVPKSEYDAVVSAVDNSTKEFLKLHDDYQEAKREIENLKVLLEMKDVSYEGLKELYNTDTEALVKARRKTEAEVAREIFEEIEKEVDRGVSVILKILNGKGGRANGKTVLISKYDVFIEAKKHLAELKKKYLPDTNDGDKVSSGDICVVCGEHVPEGRQICPNCEK